MVRILARPTRLRWRARGSSGATTHTMSLYGRQGGAHGYGKRNLKEEYVGEFQQKFYLIAQLVNASTGQLHW